MTKMNKEQDGSLLPLDQYMRGLRWSEGLAPEEEARMIERVERGKIERKKACPNQWVLSLAKHARDRLVEGYQPYVVVLANQLASRCRGMEVLDLIQEGNLGLLSAIEDNDPSRGHPLRALVGLRVRHAMLFALKEKNGTVRVCWRSRRLLAQALRVSQEVAEQLGRQPSYAEVAAHLGWTLERVVEVMAWYHYNQVESLQGMLNEDEDEDRRNVVSVFGSVAEAGESSGGEMEHRVRQAIDTCLTDRQRRVVFARYGFGDGVAAEGSYVEIGKQFGVHGTAVHSLDVAAKKRLREALAAVVGADSVA